MLQERKGWEAPINYRRSNIFWVHSVGRSRAEKSIIRRSENNYAPENRILSRSLPRRGRPIEE